MDQLPIKPRDPLTEGGINSLHSCTHLRFEKSSLPNLEEQECNVAALATDLRENSRQLLAKVSKVKVIIDQGMLEC